MRTCVGIPARAAREPTSALPGLGEGCPHGGSRGVAAALRAPMSPLPVLRGCQPRSPPCTIPAIRVMERGVAVERYADEEAVLAKKLRPISIQQKPIGLKRIGDAMPTAVAHLQRNGLLEEGQSHQRWLTGLPTQSDFEYLLRQVLLDDALERGRGHAVPLARKERLLAAVEAIRTA